MICWSVVLTLTHSCYIFLDEPSENVDPVRQLECVTVLVKSLQSLDDNKQPDKAGRSGR